MNETTDRQKKLRKILKPHLMNTKVRTAITKAITAFGCYHDFSDTSKVHPLNQLFKLLNSNGVLLLQEDFTEWSGMIGSDKDGNGRVVFTLAYDYTAYTESKLPGVKFYMPIENSRLVVEWMRIHTKTEINAYLS